jgi:hypothetical protein
MASLVLSGDTSGSITVAAPAVAGSTTQTLVNVTGTLAPIVSGTAVASTSGTSIDFTGIPSWVKRITVVFDAVSTNGSSIPQVQLGTSGGIQNTSYVSYLLSNSSTNSNTAGFALNAAANQSLNTQIYGALVLSLLNSATGQWVASWSLGINAGGAVGVVGGGSKTLSGSLDRVRITTVNGTDQFDAGSINILYE